MKSLSFRDLTVYKKAFELAMNIFRETKKFPDEEKYDNYINRSEEIGRMLNHMIENPEKYVRQNEKSLN